MEDRRQQPDRRADQTPCPFCTHPLSRVRLTRRTVFFDGTVRTVRTRLCLDCRAVYKTEAVERVLVASSLAVQISSTCRHENSA